MLTTIVLLNSFVDYPSLLLYTPRPSYQRPATTAGCEIAVCVFIMSLRDLVSA